MKPSTSVEELLARLPKLAPQKHIRGDFRRVLRQQLAEAYLAGASQDALAARMERSSAWVNAMLSEHGVPIRPRLTPKRAWLMAHPAPSLTAAEDAELTPHERLRRQVAAGLKAAYEGCLSLGKLELVSDVPQSTVGGLLLQAGVVLRPPYVDHRRRTPPAAQQPQQEGDPT